MTERKSGLPRTRSSEFGSSAHGDICDSPKHQPAIAFVGPTPSRVCGSVKPVRIGQQASATTAPSLPARPVHWNGVFSCTAHLDGRQPAIIWKGIPFRQEGDRLTGLYTFTDNFKYRDSVVFSGSLTGQSVQLTATAVRTNGSPNFTVEMSGSRSLLTGQMMSGMSQQPVRSCTLALTPA